MPRIRRATARPYPDLADVRERLAPSQGPQAEVRQDQTLRRRLVVTDRDLTLHRVNTRHEVATLDHRITARGCTLQTVDTVRGHLDLRDCTATTVSVWHGGLALAGCQIGTLLARTAELRIGPDNTLHGVSLLAPAVPAFTAIREQQLLRPSLLEAHWEGPEAPIARQRLIIGNGTTVALIQAAARHLTVELFGTARYTGPRLASMEIVYRPVISPPTSGRCGTSASTG